MCMCVISIIFGITNVKIQVKEIVEIHDKNYKLHVIKPIMQYQGRTQDFFARGANELRGTINYI